MTTIPLAEIGPHLASRGRGRVLREELIASIEACGQPWTFDFEGVLGVSDSFADELFGVTASMFGDEWFRQWVRLVNVSDVVRGAIVRSIRLRLSSGEQQADYKGPRGYEIQPPPDELPAAAIS